MPSRKCQFCPVATHNIAVVLGKNRHFHFRHCTVVVVVVVVWFFDHF